MDLFAVPTATFRLLYVLVLVRHGHREAVRCAVTDHPTAGRVSQQLREAFPFDLAPRMLIHDRDAAFGGVVASSLRAMNITPIRTSYRSPWQNGVAERFIGTIRRELLDHVIVLGEALQRHLGMVIRWSERRLAMRKRLSAIGNSLGIVIEKPILELLDIDRETELDMKTDGQQLIIVPIRRAKKAKVKAAVERAMAAHDATLRKLAK